MKYSLFKDRKITCWQRDKYEIEANSLDEAKDKLIALIETISDYDEKNGFIESEILFDTIEDLITSENNRPTIEIIDNSTGKTLYTNDNR